MYQENSTQDNSYSYPQYDQYYFNYQNYYNQGYQYNQYYPYYNYYGQYQPETQYATAYPIIEPKPATPTPCQNVTQEGTPEKQNDSGIDVISPQVQYQYQQVYEKSSEKIESDDESIDEDEDDDKENDTKSKKSSANIVKPPKPYLEIIADGILSCNVKMMQLHEIYNYMEKKFDYFAKNVNKSWRNSVRHNLSLNECFVKAGRGSNGKGNYWKIHPACEKEFIRGNFRRKSFKQMIRASSQQKSSNVQSDAQYTLPSDYSLNYSSLISAPQISQLTSNPNLAGFQLPLFNQNEQLGLYNQQYSNDNKSEASNKSQQSRFHPYRV